MNFIFYELIQVLQVVVVCKTCHKCVGLHLLNCYVLCNALISNLLFLVALHNLFEFINNYVICGVLFDLYFNISVVNLTPSAGIAALWASAGTQS